MNNIKEILEEKEWEKIGGIADTLQGFESIVILAQDIKTGFNTVKFFFDDGIFEIPESWLRKKEAVKSVKIGDMIYYPRKAYLCKIIILQKNKDLFFKEIEREAEIELENGKKFRVKNLHIFMPLERGKKCR